MEQAHPADARLQRNHGFPAAAPAVCAEPPSRYKESPPPSRLPRDQAPDGPLPGRPPARSATSRRNRQPEVQAQDRPCHLPPTSPAPPPVLSGGGGEMLCRQSPWE